MKRQPTLAYVLKHSEELLLVFFYAALLLLETGYVAWVEKLPAVAATVHPAGLRLVSDWYTHPRAEVTLLLTLLGGFLAWSGISLVSVLRHRSATAKQTTKERLKSTAFFAAMAGANLLCIHLLR